MFIYNGKLSWFHLVEKEDFTIVVPAGFAQKDPICAHWQWTIDPSNSKGKQNTSRVFSMINNIVNTVADEYKFSFSFGYYSFDAVVSRDFRTLSTTMRDITNDRSGPHTLILQYSDTSRIPSTVVYTGKLDWLHEAVNEMITLVIPSGVSALTNGSFVGMYHQWIVDSAGNKKGSHPINSTFDDVSTSSDGDITGTFSDGNRYWGSATCGSSNLAKEGAQTRDPLSYPCAYHLSRTPPHAHCPRHTPTQPPMAPDWTTMPTYLPENASNIIAIQLFSNV